MVLCFLQHLICGTDLCHHAGLYIFHMALEYALGVTVFLNINTFFFSLSQQTVNPGAILEEFWFSGVVYPWLMLHSPAEGAEWMSWLTCLETVCLWVSHNLPGVHKFCSLFVHKIQWRSLMRFVCGGLFRWGENGSTLAFSWDVEVASFLLMLLARLWQGRTEMPHGLTRSCSCCS